MKRILVPTDFSPTSERAFRFAVDLAVRMKGSVILHHTYFPVESSFIAAEQQREAYNQQAEEKIVKRLQRLKKKVMGDTIRIPVSTIVGRSPLISKTLRFAEENQVDLIVMGTQGATGLKKTIMGSVASKIVEKATCPVLLIPEKYEWKDPEQIVFATNLSASDKSALSQIETIAILYGAETTVIHLMNARLSSAAREKEKKDFDTHARKLQEKLRNHASTHFHILEVDSIIEAMEGLHSKFPYDMMAMVRRKKKLLEKFMLKSFTRNMAYVTRKPLLIIPEE